MKMIKETMKWLVLVIVGALGGMLWQVVVLPLLAESIYTQELWFVQSYRDREINVYPKEEVTITENEAVIDRFKEVESSVVGLRTQVGLGSITGTGLIYTSDGLVITLAEVVPYSGNTSVWTDDHRMDSQLVDKSLEKELATIQIRGDQDLSVASLRSTDLEVGEKIFIVGTEFHTSGVKKVLNQGTVRKIDNYIYLNITEESHMRGAVAFDLSGNAIGIAKIGIDGGVMIIPVDKIREFASL